MKKHPKVQTRVTLRVRCKRVGITTAQYDSLLKKCSFPDCNAVEPGGRGDWHLDHDAITGKFRGLLCYTHNRRVGDLTAEEALRVAKYLQERG